jgi:hypothetical protein
MRAAIIVVDVDPRFATCLMILRREDAEISKTGAARLSIPKYRSRRGPTPSSNLARAAIAGAEAKPQRSWAFSTVGASICDKQTNVYLLQVIVAC